MDVFRYSSLGPRRDEIRLLYPIQPQKPRPSTPDKSASRVDDATVVEGDLSLHFELRHVLLGESPSYTALSYVWGEKKNWTDSITVNGVKFLVGSNLHSALRNIQYEDVAPAIWIDAVCINQKDNGEKNRQVPLMRAIYSGAKHVIVWLGAATENSHLVADFLLQFSKMLHKRFDVPFQQDYPLIDYIGEFDPEELIDTIIESTPSLRSEFSSRLQVLLAVTSFVVSRAWWFRVWIIQEFVTAPLYFFQAGSRKLGSEELATFMVSMIKLMADAMLENMRPLMASAQLTVDLLSSNWIMDMHTYRETYHREGRPQASLYEILCRTYCQPQTRSEKELDAGDDRDRVYALLGLVEAPKLDGNRQITQSSDSVDTTEDDDETSIMKVDYDKHCHEVFTEVAQIVLKSGNLEILALCQHWNQNSVSGSSPVAEPEKLDPSRLPSWAPNWTQSIYLPNVWWKVRQEGHRILGYGLFSASSTIAAKVSFATHDNKNGGGSITSAILRGLRVDQVLEVKSKYPRSSTTQPSESDLLLRKLLPEITSLCEMSDKLGCGTYSSTQLQEAQWRIPIWDHEPDAKMDTVQRASGHSQSRYRKLAESLEVLTSLDEQHNLWNAITENPDPDVMIYYTYMITGPPMRPFITQRGYIGLGPGDMQSEDVVCIFLGARVPHVLRRRSGDRNGYTMIGQAYVHGIMDGELMKDDNEYEDFELF